MISFLLLKLVAFSMLLGAASFFIGHCLPDEWLTPKISKSLQRLLLGLSLFIVILRIPYREDLPIGIFGALLVLLIGCGMGLWGWKVSRKRLTAQDPLKEILPLVLIIACAITIGLFPLVSSHALFFENIGPDLDGHVLSSVLVREGRTHADFLAALKSTSGTTHWWNFAADAWTNPDFREAIGVEFLVRFMRYGHAVLSASLAWAAGEKIWFGLLSLLLFSLSGVGLVLYEYVRRRGHDMFESTLLVLTVVASHTYIIMVYEGIIGQLVASALLFYLFLNLGSLLNENKKPGQHFCSALLFSGLASIFSEGIQIFFMMLVVFLVFDACDKWRLTRGQDSLRQPSPPVLKHVALALLAIAGFWCVLSPALFVDFWVFSYYRILQGFAGGIGHADWDILAVLASFPYLRLADTHLTWNLIHSATAATRRVEMLSLIAIALFFFIYQRRKGSKEVLVGTCLAFIISLTNHRYALWKTLAMVQPLVFFGAYEMIPERLGKFRKTYGLLIYVVVVLMGFATLLNQYQHYARRVYREDYEMAGYDRSKPPVVFVTPTNTGAYFKPGASVPLYWANSGWGPKFSIGQAGDLSLGLYYTCNAEGEERCKEIQAKNAYGLQPGQLLKLDKQAHEILAADGSVDRKLLGRLIVQSFGVEPK